jgi:RNA polymerase sigma-70 factor (ECF subfamily)
MSNTADNSSESELVNRVVQGDQQALAQLFDQYRERLWRTVNFRLDQRLHGRVDADDILQEAYLSAAQRISHFQPDASHSCFVWLRLIVSQTLIDIHRRHLGAKKRDASRDVGIHGGWNAESTSYSLSSLLLGHLTSPSHAALRQELSEQLESALSAMSDIDQEVLALRHFEELTNRETAQVLDISEQAASVRYVRALARLKDVLTAIAGTTDD